MSDVIIVWQDHWVIVLFGTGEAGNIKIDSVYLYPIDKFPNNKLYIHTIFVFIFFPPMLPIPI